MGSDGLLGGGGEGLGGMVGRSGGDLELIACVPMATPVWRARYTPFGHGFVSISASGDDPTLRLWSLEAEDGNVADLVAVYHGHVGWSKPSRGGHLAVSRRHISLFHGARTGTLW